jgi:hypothetical protein
MSIHLDESSQVKSCEPSWQRMGPATRSLIATLNAGEFLEFLAELSGIENLLADPYLEGGGLHQISAGGKLGVHVDFNRHTRLQLDRRLNLLLYLNHDWCDEWGGQLELWDAAMTKPVRRIAPIFNRCVIFNTTDTSYHGHPDPLACPPDDTRRSIALYYYTADIVSPSQSPHSTIFQRRPGTDDPLIRRHTMRGRVKLLIPPILLPKRRRT